MPNLQKIREYLSVSFLGLVILLLLIFSISYGVIYISRHKRQDCNVANIKLQGQLFVYNKEITDDNKDAVASEDVVRSIEKAQNDKRIKAIILTIDSNGGSPVGGEQIMSALKNTTKPTVALIEDAGDSGAYMASLGANTIFASKYSETGDIGITASYVENSKKNIQDGLTFIQLSFGKYKDMFNQDKPMTEEEKAIAMNNLQTSYNDFIALVSENRHLPIEKVKVLAHGSAILGGEALKDGLIDQIGGIKEVKDYISQKINRKTEVCN